MGNIELEEAKNLPPKSDPVQGAPGAAVLHPSAAEFEVHVEHTSSSSEN